MWLAVHLPRLPLEALCRGETLDRPGAALSDDGARARVIAADDRAEAAGVRAGMFFSAACALAPALIGLRRDEEKEAAAVEGLAAWSGQFTSFVSVERHGVLLEIGGSLKLFGGLDALSGKIKAGVRALGYTVSAGIAPTSAGAWLLARAGIDTAVVSPALLAGRLAPVPVTCMDLPHPAVEDLRRMGVRCFGECRRLPRDGLARRISPRLVELLDKALGRRPDPRRPYTPPLVFERCINLAFEVRNSDALLRAARILLLELCGFLNARAGGVQDLEIHLAHRRAPATRLSLSLAAPGRDPELLLSLLEARMKRITLIEPVIYLGMRAAKILPLAPQNRDLYLPASDGGWDWKTLLAHLQARLSAECVYALGTSADHRPEKAWRRKRPGGRRRRPPLSAEDEGFHLFSRRRPLWLLEAPKMLKTRDGVPYWRGALEIKAGPERIESGWWDDARIARDYYVAINPGNERCWVYRELAESRRWYLHGVFE